ncbi:MAG: IS3 family transposase [Candidatus Berkelbacteria bacterium]|nr:IS3 family transposase [Candidatus Kaiserbacteria bacterium]MCR4308224.1 IS3 family transposase [Candidatus Berkelbacteria bacterium]
MDHPSLSIVRQTQLVGVSKSGLYYEPVVSAQDVLVMNALDEIYTACPFYGSRRMKVELERTQKIYICRDHVRRLMAEMGLEAIYPKKRTGSEPNQLHKKYPYLLKNLPITHPNQVWGTDITYIRLAKGFCYLVALIDWYSRYVIAWQLSDTLHMDFCLENLNRALTQATPAIHNSDQGSHFTSPNYTDILTKGGIQISMDGRGRCMDNIFTERLWRTVKYEDIYIKSYATLDDAREGLNLYFPFYNKKRPHQSLNYQTPEELYHGG